MAFTRFVEFGLIPSGKHLHVENRRDSIMNQMLIWSYLIVEIATSRLCFYHASMTRLEQLTENISITPRTCDNSIFIVLCPHGWLFLIILRVRMFNPSLNHILTLSSKLLKDIHHHCLLCRPSKRRERLTRIFRLLHTFLHLQRTNVRQRIRILRHTLQLGLNPRSNSTTKHLPLTIGSRIRRGSPPIKHQCRMTIKIHCTSQCRQPIHPHAIISALFFIEEIISIQNDKVTGNGGT
mmetsp:Transcript_37750/g.77244  ORF Transcript_37750/g.77244 Transcript_37750/m.77244 type:complete len:237 (-) Transcript_37750:550-1260(-)